MLHRELLVVFATCLTLAAARGSPHADDIAELLKRFGPRCSNSVLEDANLDVPGLIRKYRYPVEVHCVTTDDGYILEMHRIPHGRDANNDPNQRRTVVFVMHGLISSSADFVIMGPGRALAYILAEEGFDVWMGNARGNYYSRRHVLLDPEAHINNAFWKFSWDEIGHKDLPVMIDYVLDVTGEQRLHYVGHSQGTTAFFVLGSMLPAYNDKIISMHALAPVAYMAHNENLLFKILAPYSNKIERIASLLGIGEFLPHSIIYTWAGEAFCRDKVVFQPICSNILFLIGGWNENQQNTTMMPAIFGHVPAGASVRQFAHYGQGISGKQFRRYDHGTVLENIIKYGSFIPPRYDLFKITAPVFLHYSDADPLAHVKDVEILFRELGRPIAYILAEEGFDVWMGNARGNYYSRRHVLLDPEAHINNAFWKFSWDEIGHKDLPVMIDYVLDVTGEQRLHYVGHSQGTTAFFVLGSMLPAYNDKIISMHALAPVAYMAHNENLLFKILAPYSNKIERIASLLGIGEFLPHSIIYTWAGEAFCRDKVTMMPAIFGHVPAGASVRQFAHYGQGISGKQFRRYDHGTVLENIIKYGSFIPPRYDLFKITAPVFLHYSDADPLAHVKDVEILFRELGRPIGKFWVPLSGFSHIDFVYGINAKELVYNRVVSCMKAMDDNAVDFDGDYRVDDLTVNYGL
uniref:Partial AB-hydrolase lipase domain-containing protein n=1 Tax=Heliothis virescens TaxID=7102 RepID=A0A2A4K595_HELVI